MKWCQRCKSWFQKHQGCESCGFEDHGFNKWLRTAELNAHLYGQANRVIKEKTDQAHFVRQARREAKRVGG